MAAPTPPSRPSGLNALWRVGSFKPTSLARRHMWQALGVAQLDGTFSTQQAALIAADPVVSRLGAGRHALSAILAPVAFIIDIIVTGLGMLLGDEWRDRQGRKRQQQASQIDCGLRVIAGTHAGLNKGWLVRRTRVHPGGLDFGRRTPTSVRVCAVVTERQYRPRWPRWRVDSSFQIVELKTDSATLEWAVPEDKFAWAMARVRNAESPLP